MGVLVEGGGNENTCGTGRVFFTLPVCFSCWTGGRKEEEEEDEEEEEGDVNEGKWLLKKHELNGVYNVTSS